MLGKIVIPGDKISDGVLNIPLGYIQNGKTYATVVGMMDEEGRYTPLESVYHPKIEDTIVGIVIESSSWGYSLNINLASKGVISSKDTRMRLNAGDLVVGRVGSLNSFGEASLVDVENLDGGILFEVPTSKVPRIIGRKSSMINLIRDKTKTNAIVGNNGLVWISDAGNVPLVTKTIEMIVANAHTSGLTDNVGKFIEKQQ
ncbi:MAG: KH domain-containing protein [Candidatus Micrarchaeia archaeon]